LSALKDPLRDRDNKMSDSFQTFVIDQLRELGRIECRAMFGGHGLYHERVFFGILHKGRLYFKTDSAARADYIEWRMRPFRPNRKMTLKSYYEVPPEIAEDSDQLVAWASRAIRVQSPARRKH
jgi:DNA transformation protein